jgi:DNA (cytosine-5)-methyltransferase 1
MRPRSVMMENVPGIAGDARMQTVRDELRQLGYQIDDDVLNVSYYGVPQRRRRFILLGLRSTERRPSFGSPVKTPVTVRDTIGALKPAGKSGDPLHDLAEKRSARVIELIDSIPRDGGSRTDLPFSHQLACHRRTDGWKDVYGRMAWDKPAPTITGGCSNPSKGRFLHPAENRAITLREAALLQSFPPGYRFALDEGKFAVAQMIGNALPPAFVACHARALRTILSSGQ